MPIVWTLVNPRETNFPGVNKTNRPLEFRDTPGQNDAKGGAIARTFAGGVQALGEVGLANRINTELALIGKDSEHHLGGGNAVGILVVVVTTQVRHNQVPVESFQYARLAAISGDIQTAYRKYLETPDISSAYDPAHILQRKSFYWGTLGSGQ